MPGREGLGGEGSPGPPPRGDWPRLPGAGAPRRCPRSSRPAAGPCPRPLAPTRAGATAPARSSPPGAGPGRDPRLSPCTPVLLSSCPPVRLSARRTLRFDGGAAEPGGKGGPRGCALPRGGVGGVPPGAVRGPAARSCPRRGPGGASGSRGGGTQRCPGGPSPPSSRGQRRRSAAAGRPPGAPRAADAVSPRELRAGIGGAAGLQPSGALLRFPEPWARLWSCGCRARSSLPCAPYRAVS